MTAAAGPDDLLLPEGTRLIHIGPPKTGTTYLQGAFHGNREAVSAQGVHYAGRGRQPIEAVQAGLGRPSRRTGKVASRSMWQHLVDEINGAGDQRVLLSSERFSEANPTAIRSIVEDLGPDRVHIAVTLRPLGRILSSHWQQKVQSGLPIPFDEFLEQVLGDPDSDRSKSLFWVGQRHDQLIARWAEVVGPQNVTVIALDERDHDMVLRVFEQLLGLESGTLVADGDRTNRSMTLAEIEIVRAFNEQFFAEGLSRPLHARVMHLGGQASIGTSPSSRPASRVRTSNGSRPHSGRSTGPARSPMRWSMRSRPRASGSSGISRISDRWRPAGWSTAGSRTPGSPPTSRRRWR